MSSRRMSERRNSRLLLLDGKRGPGVRELAAESGRDLSLCEMLAESVNTTKEVHTNEYE